jgi:putative transposase
MAQSFRDLRHRTRHTTFGRRAPSALGHLRLARFLIHDHDVKYGGGSDHVLVGDGMVVIRTPDCAPRANSRMEGQIGSTRRECLDWLLIHNRWHLERA